MTGGHRCCCPAPAFLHCRLICSCTVSALTVLVLVTTVHTQNVTLTFSNFQAADQASFLLLGSHGIDESGVRLPESNDTQFAVGRLMYSTPIQFHNASAGIFASFKTSFVFTISPDSYSMGDGLAFLITQNPAIPAGSAGSALGLFWAVGETGAPWDATTDLVAIEIDTYENKAFDPPYAPHVGLDLNSLNSTAVSERLSRIQRGRSIGVWIDYSAVSQELVVKVSITDPPVRPTEAASRPVLNYTAFNLSSFLSPTEETSYIGFSAATGGSGQVNIISEWNFSTSLLATTRAPEPAPSSSPGPGGAASDSGNLNLGLVVGPAIVAAALVLGVSCCVLLIRRRKNARSRGARTLGLPKAGYGPRSIGYHLLKKATKDFSTILGEGGFGGVYKGVLEDGTQVAVKRIKQPSEEGEKQFLAEVTSIGQLSHRNLVPLKGWCHEHGELLLVYEYMPNGSLDHHLYGPNLPANTQLEQPPSYRGLDWETRFNIIRGVADALCYLHGGWQQPLIHRDIKPSNVMLDANLSARLGDFGLAVAVSNRDKILQTVSRAAGTLGYLAPECQQDNKVGADADVFSFGVMVLEVVCGRKPFDRFRPPNEFHLVTWVWSLYAQAEEDLSIIDAVVDPLIRAECKEEQAVMLLKLGLMCSFPDAWRRPSMSPVTQFLAGSLQLPHLPREVPPAWSSLVPATTSNSITTGSSSSADTSTDSRHLTA